LLIVFMILLLPTPALLADLYVWLPICMAAFVFLIPGYLVLLILAFSDGLKGNRSRRCRICSCTGGMGRFGAPSEMRVDQFLQAFDASNRMLCRA